MKNSIYKTSNTTAGEPAYVTYLHSKAASSGVPVSGTFELTSRCNFNCKMCYVHNAECNKQKLTEKSAKWWLDTARDAVSQGLVFLLLTGGEAVIRDDFEEIYTGLNEMGVITSLNSNGYFLNGKIADLFKKYPPNRINISLYGTNDETYEQLTGVRAFSNVVENIRLMKSIGIDVRLNCSITPHNCSDVENIYQLSRDLGVRIKTTSYMFPKTRVGGVFGANNARLSPSEAAQYRVKWMKMTATRDEFLSRLKSFEKGINEFEEPCVEEVVDGKVRCRAGSSSFWINKDGILLPCGLFDNGFAIDEYGFAKAWKMAKSYTSSLILPRKCEMCKYRFMCNVCAAACYTETGDFSGVPEYVCRFTEETVRIMEKESERLGEPIGN